MESYSSIGWFFPCNATDKCKIVTLSLQKNQPLLKKYLEDSTLSQMATCVIRL